MLHKVAFIVAALSLPVSIQAATSRPANLAEEYDQVRAIAQRDPKVRAAYEAADHRLAEKIVEIDPALKGYTPGKTSASAKPAPEAKHVGAKKQPAAKAPAKAQGVTHTVAKGETLDGIAIQYHVSAASIKAANHIQDARKLAVGQKLVIPGGKATTAKASTAKAQPVNKSTTTAPAATKEQSFWDKFKF